MIHFLIRCADAAVEAAIEFSEERAPIPTALALITMRRARAFLSDRIALLEKQLEPEVEDPIDEPAVNYATPAVGLTPAAVAMRYDMRPPVEPVAVPEPLLAGSIEARLEAARRR